MTPAARLATAAEILDRIAEGMPAEQALTRWARGARHAGSGDRAAVRDHVFDVLRRWRSTAHRGGGTSGRARVLGLLRQQGAEAAALFDGSAYGLAPLSEAEAADPGTSDDPAVALDCPDWLWPVIRGDHGAQAAPILDALRHRAPVHLRVNAAKATPESAAAALAEEGIETVPGPLSPHALEVTRNPRRVQNSRAYREGLVELQDAASQALVDLLPLAPGQRVLDFCAGGGGKSLAMAAREPGGAFFVHDANRRRMADLPARAGRAGVTLTEWRPGDSAGFDLVLADAPCSGSGAWRRAPQGKWLIDAAGLEAVTALQDRVLAEAAAQVAPGGWLAYATCSILSAENGERSRAFAGAAGWEIAGEHRFTPLDGGDGFYLALLRQG